MVQLITYQNYWLSRLSKFCIISLLVVASATTLAAKNIHEIDDNFTCQEESENDDSSIFSNLSNAASATFLAMPAPCPGGTDVIGGKVFRDFNFDGDQDTGEPFQSDIEVFLFTCGADEMSQAVTSIVVDDSGEYFFSGLTPGQKYRVEFVIPESLDFLGFTTKGTENGTNVQFAEPGTCDVSVGVGYEAEYHQDNPFLAAPCYINGSGAEGTAAGDSLAFLAIEYNAEGENQNINLFSASQVGSLWGVAYERSTKTIFSSAVLRRHMGFGPGGTGGIYFMDVNDINNPSIAGILDLDALGYNTGTDPRITTPLPSEFDVPNHDVEAFGRVAKMSLGDIDIAEDGKTLYTINLLTKELITIDISEYVLNGTLPGAAHVTSTPIPAFNCDLEADWRVWGLRHYQGDLYIGGVCSAEMSQDAADLTATVVKYDGTDFTEFYDMTLDFQRGDPFSTDLNQENERNQWFPWTDDYTVIRTDEVNGRFAYPQPILADIEFDTDGSMILGFMDRTGHQGGFLNYPPDVTSSALYSAFVAGDMVRVCNVNGTLVLEGAQDECTNPIGSNWPQGPNGKEFYWEDQYPENPTGDRARFVIHNEITLGALALLPGSGDVVTTVFDPLLAVNAGGVSWFDNTTGNRDRDYQIFATQSGQGVGFPGKSNGLGDLELICNQAPSEVGNYVWQDCNGDGVQDPCEAPIPGVDVAFYKEDGTLVATTTTNSEGEYYFNDMSIAASTTSADTKIENNTTYYIVFGANGQFDATNNVMTIGGVEYQMTEANSGQTPNDDVNDSDPSFGGTDLPAFFQGLQVAAYTSGCTGYVDHTIDAGFSSGVVTITVEGVNSNCPEANDGVINVTAMISDGSPLEYSFDNGATFQPESSLMGVAPGAYTIVVQPIGGGSGGCGSSATTSITIGENTVPSAAITQDFLICMDETIPAGSGMSADCEPCADGSDAVVTWWDSAVGGTEVGQGSYFDPTAVGLVDNTIAGEYIFYSQCNCGPCESPREASNFTVVTNPTPLISGPDYLCPQAVETYTLSSDINSGHIFTWELLDGGGTFIGSNVGTSVTIEFTTTESPLRLKVIELGPPGTICEGEDIIEIEIKDLNLICNDNIQISLNDDGCAFIYPGLILENSLDDTDFSVDITNQYNEHFGNKVTCENIGQLLTAKITNICDANSCWSTIVVEDKRAPIIDCPVDPIEIECTTELTDVPFPTAVDNCTENVIVTQINHEVDASNACNGVMITRTFTAADEGGYTAEPCIQIIEIISPPLPDFPEDITWLCEQYNAYPNIIEPTVLASNIFDTDLSTSDIEVPYYLTQTTLASTGSGLIDIAQGLYCNYSSSISDDTIAVCGGVKILRTWSILNWCTGEVIIEDINGDDNLQVIRVIDNEAPLVSGEDFTVNANVEANFPATCSSTGEIPLPMVTDNCSNYSIRIFTPIGEADYVNGVDATDGASIPEAGLHIGNHLINYSVKDECGNESELFVTVSVVDNEIPAPICDAFSEATINSEGYATVYAATFDDGSTDNCCIDHFEVKRMTDLDSDFASSITFDCAEVGETIMVEMAAVDCFENRASCMVEIIIEDKELPRCSAPINQAIDCTQYLEIDFYDTEQLDELFGAATGTDNCEAFVVSELEPTIDVTTCNIGSVTRRFQTIDVSGNESIDACIQTIAINYVADYEITFPGDFEGICNEVAALDTVQTSYTGCDLLAVSYTDQFFDISGDLSCYKIIRRWEVINWCIYELGDEPVVLNDEYSEAIGETIDETTFGNASFYRYTQIIKVQDDTAPMITFNSDTEFCADAECLLGSMSLPLTINDDCSTENIDIYWSYDENNDGTYDETGTGIFEGAYPLGDHRVLYTVSDRCGNNASTAIEFSIVDCKAPVAYCSGGIVTDLMNTSPPMVSVWANDLNAGSYDNCGGEVTFSFTANPLDTGMVFTCDEIGTNTVNIYVWDEAGNVEVCQTLVEIQDNLLDANGTPCAFPDGDVVIAGSILTEGGEGLQDAMIELNGSNIQPIASNTEGAYSFNNVPEGYDYSVTTMHDVDADNGVTVYDLVLIRSHILNLNTLSSPYKMIAADANNSQSVTTSDIIELRKLILAIDTELANNTSWRFIDAAYEFPNPQNPWETGFPEVININNLATDELNADFVAVKIGDLNGNAQANLQSNSEERSQGETLYFGVKDTNLKENTSYTLDITAKDYNAIAAYQFTLNFDVNALEFEKVTSTNFISESNMNLINVANGVMTLAHSDEAAKDVKDETILFSLTFTAKKAGKWSDFIEINSNQTKAIAYRQNGIEAEAMNVAFDFGTTTEGFTLFQNRPNPFLNTTIISFSLEEKGAAKLSIYNVNGQLVKQIEEDFSAGYHEVNIDRSELGTGSIFYYQLDTDSHSAVRKMVVIK